MAQVAPNTVYVAERATGLIHVEESFDVRPGKPRLSRTRCGRVLNFDNGEASGRIFCLGLAHLDHDPCDECRGVSSAESEQLAMAEVAR